MSWLTFGNIWFRACRIACTRANALREFLHMSSSKDHYREFMRATLETAAAGPKEAPPAPGHTVRHQLVENVAGSVFVFNATPDNALSTVLAADAAAKSERRSSKRRSSSPTPPPTE